MEYFANGSSKKMKVVKPVVTETKVEETVSEVPKKKDFLILKAIFAVFALSALSYIVTENLKPKGLETTFVKFLQQENNSVAMKNYVSISNRYVIALEKSTDPLLLFSLAYNTSKFETFTEDSTGYGIYRIDRKSWGEKSGILSVNGLINVETNTALADKIISSYYKKYKNYKDTLYSYNGRIPEDFEKESLDVKQRKINFIFEVMSDYSKLVEINKGRN